MIIVRQHAIPDLSPLPACLKEKKKVFCAFFFFPREELREKWEVEVLCITVKKN